MRQDARPSVLSRRDLRELLGAGASDDVLHAIMVDNPRRFLAFVPKKARR